MGFKAKGYDRDVSTKERDCSLFAIACEGAETEPNYFKYFEYFKRIKVDIITHEESPDTYDTETYNKNNKSAPKYVLQKAQDYLEKYGLDLSNKDSLWLVIDVDQWEKSSIQEVYEKAKSQNINLIISNPCFEIWLLFHWCDNLDKIDCSKSTILKKELNKLKDDKFCHIDFLKDINKAIINAKKADQNIDYYWPEERTSKVYILAEQLMNKIGYNAYQKFIEITLPKLREEIRLKGKINYPINTL